MKNINNVGGGLTLKNKLKYTYGRLRLRRSLLQPPPCFLSRAGAAARHCGSASRGLNATSMQPLGSCCHGRRWRCEVKQTIQEPVHPATPLARTAAIHRRQ